VKEPSAPPPTPPHPPQGFFDRPPRAVPGQRSPETVTPRRAAPLRPQIHLAFRAVLLVVVTPFAVLIAPLVLWNLPAHVGIVMVQLGGVTLLVGIVALAVGKIKWLRITERKHGCFAVLAAFVLIMGGLGSAAKMAPPQNSPPQNAPPASPGFRFSVGDALVNVNNGVEVGVIVRTETAHTFRNGTVGRAYIVAMPNGVEMDMVADVLERIAGKR
jgi:hypothetical protein